MGTLYIASPKSFAGKTLFAVTLAKDAQRRGQTVHYFKPVGSQLANGCGPDVDNDAMHVAQLLGLEASLSALCPVPMSDRFREQVLKEDLPPLLPRVKEAYGQIARGADLVVAGGTGSLFSAGVSFGLPSWSVAEAMDARVLVVTRYKPERTVDELLAARRIFGERMVGAMLNAVRPDHLEQVNGQAKPFLEKQGVPVFGALPEEPLLHAMTVRDLMNGLCARLLTGEDYCDELIERYAIGAMTPEAALSHFRRMPNKAVITGSDRSDVICAALETSLRALVLTGGYDPAARVLSEAAQHRVPVLLVQDTTLVTLEKIDNLLEHMRFRQPQKIELAERMVQKHIDLDRFWAAVGAPSVDKVS